MGRFSPTVLPQGFDFGGILESLAKNYLAAKGLKEQGRQTKRRETREDTQDAIAQDRQRTVERSAPGARTLADFLNDPGEWRNNQEPVAAEDQNTEGFRRMALEDSPVSNIAGMANASQPVPDIELQPRPAMPAFLPGGRTVGMEGVQMPVPTMVPQQQPFVTRLGTVMDPRQAGRQKTLGDAIERESKMGGLRDELTIRKEFEPTADERVDLQRRIAEVTGLTGQRGRSGTGGGLAGTPQDRFSVTMRQKVIDDLQQDMSLQLRLAPKVDGDSYPEEIAFYNKWLEKFQTDYIDRLDSLKQEQNAEVLRIQLGIQALRPSPAVADTTKAPPPPPVSLRPNAAPTAAPGPTGWTAPIGGAPPVAPDRVMRMKKIIAAHPKWTDDEVLAELHRQDERGGQ